MKLVLDTVVLVRGLVGSQGAQGQLLFDRSDEYVWIASRHIVQECMDVLSRPELQRRFSRMGTHHQDILMRQIAAATLVHPVETPRICRDPHDDMYLAAALAGGADANVSEDKDLRSLGMYEGLSIGTAQTMIAVLAGRDEREAT